MITEHELDKAFSSRECLNRVQDPMEILSVFDETERKQIYYDMETLVLTRYLDKKIAALPVPLEHLSAYIESGEEHDVHQQFRLAYLGALMGNALCQYQLGHFFSGYQMHIGDDVYKDFFNLEKWKFWAEKSSTQGCVGGTCLLALYYDHIKDTKTCNQLMQSAADQGDAHACYNLGIDFENEKNYEKACYWYQRSFDLDPTDEDVLIALCFTLGKLRFFQKAIDALLQYGNPKQEKIQYLLGQSYKQLGQKTDAVQWFIKAAEQGNQRARKALEEL